MFFSYIFKATHALADCQDMWGHKNDTNGTDLVAYHCKDLEYWLSKVNIIIVLQTGNFLDYSDV